ncbi:Bug family tripartite tricarboxylate transporter substrate binding protein [Rhodoferax ferrireducens]|uniref:Bug family tripartite tricarboxylate transporter substrate binding protein n=1 Tax=Rhodoferax ferrireducens TaxID=192843 RepID=UPI000E0DABCD|nr:tripartite tricarboxylate transporter substrate binding protein [Rhodoferax ferrireducens]
MSFLSYTIPLKRVFLALALASVATGAFPQSWPTRPLTVIVPFPAGGGTDLVIRAIQSLLQKELGQPIIIDNRSGAGGTIGSAMVAKAAPDGYTMGVATTSTHAVSVSVFRQVPYDPTKDFEYVGFIGTSPYVLAVHPSLKAPDIKTLIATLRKNPRQYSFGSVGAGTVSQLMGEKFKEVAGVPLVHVPYRGAAPAYADLVGGQVQILFDNPLGLSPFIRSGQLVAVAATASNALLPGIPTFAQQGVPNFDQTLWYGIAFPKGTPKAIVNKFNSALNKVLSDRAVAADLASKGINANPASPETMRAAVVKDIAYWGKIATSVGAKVD